MVVILESLPRECSSTRARETSCKFGGLWPRGNRNEKLWKKAGHAATDRGGDKTMSLGGVGPTLRAPDRHVAKRALE